MDFTIEITKTEKKEDININELEMFHKECDEGKIEFGKGMTKFSSNRWYTKYRYSHLLFFCKKCKQQLWVCDDASANLSIIKTAIDGEQRDLTNEGCRRHIESGAIMVVKDIDNISTSKMIYGRKYKDFDIYDVKVGVVGKEPIGEEDEDEVYCFFCGEQLMSRSVYCHMCGSKVEDRIKEVKKISTSNK